MASSRPGNGDRGWNDPPVFDYQGNQANNFTQHAKLNKRVAYDMSGQSSVPTGTATLLNPSDGPPRLPPIQILPPSSTASAPIPLPVVVPALSPTTDPCGDSVLQPAIFSPTASTVPGVAQPVGPVQGEVKVKDLPSLLAELSLPTEESLLLFVKDGLNAAAESVKDMLQEKAMEDVKKKIDLMMEWWTGGKMSPSVKSQLGSLVAALNRQQVEEAYELHLALMINHTTEVNQWMVAIKRIVQEHRSKGTRSLIGQNESQTQTKVTDASNSAQSNDLLVPGAKEKQSEESLVPGPSSSLGEVTRTSTEGNS